MKRAIELSWTTMLALLVCGALSVAGCGDDKKGDEDATTDVTSDLEPETILDGIPDPTTEPPEDTSVADTLEDSPTDVPWDGTGGVVGDGCVSDEDCGGVPSTSSYCMTDIGGYIPFPGGYCSASCTTNDECGPGGFCLNVYIMSFCLKECDDGSDCREGEGYECAEPPYIGGGPYCIPVFDIPEGPMDASTDAEPDMAPDAAIDTSIDSAVD